MKPFAHRLRDRDPLLGAFVIEMPVRAVPEAYALAGFDFLVLDLEHSETGLERLGALVVGARAAGIASLVRIEAGGDSTLTRVLDLRPDGVMVPGVADLAEARRIVRLARFHPLGNRGLAPMIRHEAAGGVAGTNDATALVLQIEGLEAVEEAARIAAVEGVDGVFVGPYDLSQALGLPGRLDHEVVLAAGTRIAADVAGKAALGVYVSDAAQAPPWQRLGATFFTHATDGQLLLAAARDAHASWHGARAA